MEKFIGDVYERKEFEYIIVSKVPHESELGKFVYLVSRRKFGTEEYEYFIEIY